MSPFNKKPWRISIYRRPATRRRNHFIGPIILLGFIAIVLQLNWMQRNRPTLERLPLDPELVDRFRTRLITMYECDTCSGSGLYPRPTSPGQPELCPICFGVGYHATRRLTDGDRMCITCGGMGRHFNEHGEPEFCPRCGGRGMVDMDEVQLPADTPLLDP